MITHDDIELVAAWLLGLAAAGGWCAWAWLYVMQGWADLDEAQRQRARAFWAAMARINRGPP